MGTDIHMIVEIYNHKTKQWEMSHKKIFPDIWGGNGLYNAPQLGRNYDLFDILSTPYQHFIYHNDFPNDLSEEGRTWTKKMEEWTFSPCWCTLFALQKFNWTKELGLNCYLTPQDFQNYLNGILPKYVVTDYAVINESPRIFHYEGQEFESLDNIDLVDCVIDVDQIIESCDYFISVIIPLLESLIPEDGSSQDIRLVYCFDN